MLIDLSAGQRVSLRLLVVVLLVEASAAIVIAQPHRWTSCPGEATPPLFWLAAGSEPITAIAVIVGTITGMAGVRHRLYLLSAWLVVAGALAAIWWWDSATWSAALDSCP